MWFSKEGAIWRRLLLISSILLSACAFGQTSSHTVGSIVLDLETASPVAVGVWDNRKDVVSGERQPSWIGLQRSLYGIPYGVTTSSGKPFAEELGAWLVRSLGESGIDAEAVHVPIGSSHEDVVELLASSSRSRLLLVRLDEWYADTHSRTTLHYGVTLEVLDSRGSVVVNTSLSGEDIVGRKQREGRRSVSEATEDIMGTLLTRNDVAEALASSDLVLSSEERRCTVQQILQMRESGLTEEQIRAACGE